MTDPFQSYFEKKHGDAFIGPVRERYGKYATIVGIASNFLLFLLKIIAGTMFNSISVTADAINNLSDSGSSLITFLGFGLSSKPADDNHPYGHGRTEYIAGLIVAFVITYFGLQLLISSIDKVIHPNVSPMQFSVVSIVVLLFSILVKLWQSLFYKGIGKKLNSVTLLATSIDSRNDVVATSAILLAMLLSRLVGFNLDGYMGVIVSFYILLSGINIMKDTATPLLGTAPTKELVDSINNKILSYDHIIGLHDLSVHSYGAMKRYASVHCEVPADLDMMQGHEIIDGIERDFLKELDIHLVIHLDPVIADDAKTNQLLALVITLINEISPEINMHDFRVVWGLNHTKLIFDVVVPFGFPWSDEMLAESIEQKISDMDRTYSAVVIIDRG